MTFPWLDRTAPAAHGPSHRQSAAERELRERAAMLARLGVSTEDAIARLCARVAWEFDPCSKGDGCHQRPEGLCDESIGTLVRDVYASKRY